MAQSNSLFRVFALNRVTIDFQKPRPLIVHFRKSQFSLRPGFRRFSNTHGCMCSGEIGSTVFHACYRATVLHERCSRCCCRPNGKVEMVCCPLSSHANAAKNPGFDGGLMSHRRNYHHHHGLRRLSCDCVIHVQDSHTSRCSGSF